jgi:isopenicillin N synthase-like dioxygenase
MASLPPSPLPVVDLSAPHAGPDLIDALRSHASALLVNHGVDPELRRSVIELSRAFFARPEAEKARVRWDGTGPWSGWQPVYEGAGEITGDRVPDLVERFECQELATFALWPDRPVGFAEAWTAYYDAAGDLASHLVRLAVEVLDLPTDALPAWTDQQFANLVANHYLPQPDPPLPGQTRVGAHTDRGGITLLSADEAPGGLEVRPRGRGWTPVVIPEDAYVVQVGDLFSRWTNRRIPANLHRVVNPPREVAAEASRLALVYFHYPALDSVVAPAPSCVDSEHPPIEAIVAGEHLFRRQEAFKQGAAERYALT